MPKISVIIPVYNYGPYLAETLDSLIIQTYKNWECIIIDDGSKDNTAEVANLYTKIDTRIQYIYQKNQGVSAARNNGLTNATGEYIQFLDADDLLAAGKLETHWQYLENHHEIDIVYSDSRYFISGDLANLSYSLDMQNVEWLPKVDGQNTALSYLVEQNIMPIQAPLSRRKLLQQVGLFDQAIRYCEDWDYWFRCAIAGGKFCYLDSAEAMSYIRVHSISASQNSEALATGAKQMQRKILDYLERHPNDISAFQLTSIRRQRALDYVKEKKYFKGLGLFLRTTSKASDNKVSFLDMLYWIRKTL